MSDRRLVIELSPLEDGHSLRLIMDGETGTWRLFIETAEAIPAGLGEFIAEVELSLSDLKYLSKALGKALDDIESLPEIYNAEVRAAIGD
jgi:hypothetical protein